MKGTKETVNYEEVIPSAPLTSSQPKENPRLKYSFGRDVIKIPLSEESVNEITLQRYLPDILSIHARNVAECIHFEKVYKGDTHIFDKIRPINEDKKNTIVNENHAFYMVEFKKGYMFGNPIKYSCVDDSDMNSTDEIKVFNKYMVDQKKSAKDIELGETIFKCGNAYRMILPKKYGKVTNILKESPFDIINLDNETTFVVYSSDYTKKKLFGGIITTLDSPNPNNINYEILIYTKTHSYRFRCWSLTPIWDGIDFVSKKRHYLGHIPIIEYYTNTARLGVIDIVETLLDAVNDISSDSIDNINDFVNSVLAIYNMEVDEDSKKAIETYKLIPLKTTDPSRPADAKYLTNALQQADVMTRYETLVKVAYNISGVPQPTTKTTSGGDTGDARELGGGWESANIIAKQNEEPLKQGEYMVAEIMLAICRMIPNCPVNSLYTSDIEINFNRTNRDNLFTKAQVLKYFIDMGMPEEIALNMVGISANPHEVAIAWANNREKIKQETLQQAQISQSNKETKVDEKD